MTDISWSGEPRLHTNSDGTELVVDTAENYEVLQTHFALVGRICEMASDRYPDWVEFIRTVKLDD